MTQRHALLPTHPLTGLQALGWTSRGPIWPALGGSEDEPEEVHEDQDEGEEEQPEDEDKPLGPQGEKALQAEKEKRRNEANRRREAERQIAALKAELEKATKPAKDGDAPEGPDPDEIRRQIQAELAAETARERVLDKIEVKAAKGFADPGDAAALLLKSHSLEDFLDDGKPDVEAIQEALDALLESKPYLGAAQGGNKRFKGTGDGGAKPVKPSRPTSLHEAVSNRFKGS